MTTQTSRTDHDLGPLEPLLADKDVVEILIDGYDRIYVERRGQFEDVPAVFRDNDHLLEVIDHILASQGRHVDENVPMVDARLPDGSRVNVVLPPVALNGPSVTIRKFTATLVNTDDLLRLGAWDETLFKFLRACVYGRLNMVICGGTGSGKTTVLNAMASLIPGDERIITIEPAAELRLPQKRVVRLEARPPNLEGRGEITLSDLVINALRMRPDRLIAGEVRGAEALHLLSAMNTGHDGSMFTMHASGPRDALARLEVMAGSANPSIPLVGLREMMASALDLIIDIQRLSDGSRKIVKVCEVQGMQGDAINLADLFVFQQTGVDNGKVSGRFAATGQIPKFLSRIRDAGIDMPMDLFTPG